MAQSTLNRRALITGRVLTADRVVPPPGCEIASIIVQARPERLDELEAEIAAMPGCENSCSGFARLVSSPNWS